MERGEKRPTAGWIGNEIVLVEVEMARVGPRSGGAKD